MITLMCFSCITSLHAQVYSGWGLNPNGSVYDTINFTGDTLRFQFSNIPAGAYGQGRLVIYFEGDFSDNTEYLTVNFAGSTSASNGPYDSLGLAGPNSALVNCAPEDSNVMAFSVDTINAYAPDLAIILIPSGNVQTFVCTRNRARVHLEYTYCPFGIPVEFATITIPDSVFCSLDGPVTLSGTPAGGVFSGAGTSGGSFDPYGLAAGIYTITYTAADSIGCFSSASATVTVQPTPDIADTVTCPGIPVTLDGTFSNLLWFSDAGLTNQVGSGSTFTTPPAYATASYYALYSCNNYYFRLDTLLADSISIVDNNAVVGDDEGGIAVTSQYIYYRATTGTIRYDADLTNPSNPLPLRDGMFSDLASGQLYSLWDTQANNDPDGNNGYFTANALIALNTDLSFGQDLISLSQPIDLGLDNYFMNGIFAGAGVVGLYSGNTNHFYAVNLCNGNVTDLGENSSPKFEGTESWAVWGVLEYDGTDYSIIFRDSLDDDMHRMVLPAGAVTSVGTFPSGLADLACMTYSPWNKNWYFHFEGVSGALGGTAESTGYANASDSLSLLPGGSVSCAQEITVFVNNADLGPDTALCQQNYTLFAGLGYSSYTWNGINSNFNSYTASNTDTVIFQGLYQDGCNHLDTVIITMNVYPVVDLGGDITDCGGPVTLDASNPGAVYVWSDASTSQTLQVSASGTYTVTVTDSNGCSSSDDNQVTIHPLPAVTATLNPALVCINWAPFVLTGGSPAGGTWSGTAVSNGSFIPSFAGTGSFPLTYTVVDSNGCPGSATQSITVDACTGIADPGQRLFLTVMPNPGNGLFMLQSGYPGTKNLRVETTDISGKTVAAAILEMKAGVSSTLDLTGLPAGIYTLTAFGEKQIQHIRLVIQR